MRHPIILAIGLAGVAGAQAEEPSVRDAPPIVVTATRLAVSVNDTLQNTSVITRADIEAGAAPDVLTLLRNEAGVETYQSGGIGKQSSLFVRGNNADHVLVLVDGVRVNSATVGATALDQILPEQVDHIEIVRGNVSHLYGSEAIGGVIQIFTRAASDAPPGWHVSAAAGGENTRRLAAGLSTRSGGTAFALDMAQFDTDGFPAVRARYVPLAGLTTLADLNDNGYHQSAASARLTQELAPGQIVGLTGYMSRGRVSYAGAFQNSSHPDLSSWSLFSDNRIASNWHSRITAARGVDDLDSFLDGTLASRFRTTNDQLTWHNEIEASRENRFTAGLEQLVQKVASDTAFSTTDRRVESGYAGWLGRRGPATLQINGRTDRYTDFGTRNTGLAGLGWELNTRWRAEGTFSTAFKAPTFNELYNPFGGNPLVKPERSRNSELGLRYHDGGLEGRLTLFHNELSDLIEFVPPNFVATNVDRARVRGVEGQVGWTRGDTTVHLGATVQDPRDRDKGDQLLRRARHFASLSATQRLGAWRIHGEVVASGPRYDIHFADFTRVRLGGYTVVNAVADYRINARTLVGVRVENLLDRDYELAHGYNVQRRLVLATLRIESD